MSDSVEIIADPLQWQQEVDSSGLSMNLRGSARFWATVEHLLGHRVVYRDGAPEMSEVVIELVPPTDEKPGVGLELKAGFVYRSDFDDELAEDDERRQPWIEFRFVPLDADARSEDIEARTVEQIKEVFEGMDQNTIAHEERR